MRYESVLSLSLSLLPKVENNMAAVPSSNNQASDSSKSDPKLTLAIAWQSLSQEHQRMQTQSLNDLFAKDPNRYQQFSLTSGELTLDYSKSHIDTVTMAALTELASAAGLPAAIAAMFSGKPINTTENRAVGHVALRAAADQPFVVDGVDQMPFVMAQRENCYRFAKSIRSGRWLGETGRRITDVVNIGTGGSDLGARMVTTALTQYATGDVKVHFVANIDGHDLFEKLGSLAVASTLFIVSSKTFRTQETMTNAAKAKAWFFEQGGKNVARHFVAVSSNTEAVTAFGIAPENMFGFWDWVGGRFSMWSSIGLPIMISVGPDHFDEFLAGARAMDQHFSHAPLAANLPVLLAILEIWYRNFWGTTSRCVAPYHHRLRSLPSYLQQLEMESLGKRVDVDGNALAHQSGGVVWGEPGTNGQHAYFQLLHQGTNIIPVDFIVAAQSDFPAPDQQRLLVANCIAQSRALMIGRDLQAAGGDPHKVFEGNRPSNTIFMKQLTAKSLGELIALYEHKVFVCSVIWRINAFDQWGVELGKVLAGETDRLLLGEKIPSDSSTLGLVGGITALMQD